jgi:predicted nucleic acid-binding protein
MPKQHHGDGRPGEPLILVDTSIWVDHLRRVNSDLLALLEAKSVLSHPQVVGEIALGSIASRAFTLRHLARLPQAAVARDTEVLLLINEHRFFGRGIGYNDAHLLASCLLTPGTALWTRDKKLQSVAADLGINLPR